MRLLRQYYPFLIAAGLLAASIIFPVGCEVAPSDAAAPVNYLTGYRLFDEGTYVGTSNSINCVGAGVTCTKSSGRGVLTIGGGGGSGDVVGPGSATDNAIVRFDSTTGKLVQNSAVTIDDSGNVALAGSATVDGRDVSVYGTKLDGLPTSAYATVQSAGSSITQRGTINFISGTGVTASCVDNSGSTRSDCTVSSSYWDGIVSGSVTTTDAAATACGSAYTITAGHSLLADIYIIGRLATGDSSEVRYYRQNLYGNTAGTVTLRNSAQPYADFEDTTPTNLSGAAFSAPTISGATIRMNVAGIATPNMTWRCLMRIIEI